MEPDHRLSISWPFRTTSRYCFLESGFSSPDLPSHQDPPALNGLIRSARQTQWAFFSNTIGSGIIWLTVCHFHPLVVESADRQAKKTAAYHVSLSLSHQSDSIEQNGLGFKCIALWLFALWYRCDLSDRENTLYWLCITSLLALHSLSVDSPLTMNRRSVDDE
jgi:hypothetical protein